MVEKCVSSGWGQSFKKLILGAGLSQHGTLGSRERLIRGVWLMTSVPPPTVMLIR
jgi:hypothetical protein